MSLPAGAAFPTAENLTQCVMNVKLELTRRVKRRTSGAERHEQELRAGGLGGAPLAPPSSLKPAGFEQVEALVGPGPRGHAPAAEDEADAEGDAAGERDRGADAGQAQRGEDDADEVEGRLLDLDPRHGLGREKAHRRSSPEATVLFRGAWVNWRLCVRFSASR